mgnify:FL=1
MLLNRPPAPVFLVVCTADIYNRIQGRYAAQLTTTGAVVAHHIERAARYASQYSAIDVASRLASKFTGTAGAAVALVEKEVCHG